MNELNVQKYLRENGVQALVDNYGIITKDYPAEKLLVLNYSQIDSPKNDPITNECRGLILNRETFDVVSRSFDRFYNYGEAGTDESIDFSKCQVVEKRDGSLLKLFFHQGYWYCSTRGTAFAESDVNGWGITFADLVYRALGLREGDYHAFNHWCDEYELDNFCTYICELTATENRVVTKYDGTKLALLAVRNNKTGEYVKWNRLGATRTGLIVPKTYEFDTVDHCLQTVKELRNLEEGYVLYDKVSGQPLCKIKSPAYVAAHRLKSEGLNPKRIAQLILMNEVDEYLSVFPEDKEHFVELQEKHALMMINLHHTWKETRNINDRKQFALKVKDHPLAAVLFQAKNTGRDDPDLVHLFHQQTEAYQLRALGVK